MLSLFSSKSQHDPIPHFFRTLATCPPSCPVNQCLIDCECRPQNECPKDLTLVLMIVFGIATLIILVLLVVYLCTRERKGNRLANRAIQGRPANAHPVDENHLAPVNMPILGNTQQNLYVAANPQGIAPNPNQFNTSPAQYLNLKLIVNTSPDANANPQVHLQPQPQSQPPSQFAVNPPANLDASSFGLVNNNNRTEIAMEESALNKSAFKDLSQIHEDPDASNSHMKAGTEPNDISISNNKAIREVGKEEFQREKSIPNKSILNELSQMIEENDASNVQAQAAEAHHNSVIQNKLQTEDAKDDSRQEKSFNKSATKELSHTKESNVIIHKTTLNILDKFEIAESKNE